MDEFEIIVDKIGLFEKMYDSIRIVDPIKKEVLELIDGELCTKSFECYKFWNKETACENCISMRAYNENDAIFKMEYSGDKIYMITAVPIVIKGKRLVAELLKDATKSLYFEKDESGKESKMICTIENINRVVVKDELTNLYNRRFIDERLPADLLKSSLKKEPLSIIFADLDFFKTINDTYGHIAGDQVLKEFAKELKKYIRKGVDWAARYGGEEFMICLSNTDIDTARSVAERIRKNLMEKEIVIGNNKINVTGSFGVHTVCDGNKCLTMDGIIEIVDKNLYKAKAEGRNRVI